MRGAIETLRTARELAIVAAALACFLLGAACFAMVQPLRAFRDACLVSAILAAPFLVCAACDAR